MPYVIFQFDELAVPEHLESGSEQNMGTGAALTSFLQLPGGGFYDNYGSRKSPQGIRPITKTCLLWGEGADSNARAADTKNKLDSLRKKIGKRGKLTVKFDDGSLRWQWARLTEVNAPRSTKIKVGWLPVELTWITAAQHWYGAIQGDGWFWGDETWVWGDGTSILGQSDWSHRLSESAGNIFLEHGGNVDAVDFKIEIDFTAGGDCTLTFRNIANGAAFTWTGTAEDGDRLLIDAGARAAVLVPVSTRRTIGQVSRQGSTVTIDTTMTHGYMAGDDLLIEGTENYDGRYRADEVTSFGVTSYVDPPVEALTTLTEHVGHAFKLQNEYADLTLYDRQRWFFLSPGTNQVNVTVSGDILPGFIEVEYDWNDHFA